MERDVNAAVAAEARKKATQPLVFVRPKAVEVAPTAALESMENRKAENMSRRGTVMAIPSRVK
jgi:hypothetical protein